MNGSGRNVHRRTRVSVVLSMLGALAATLVWSGTVATMVVAVIRRDYDVLSGWGIYGTGLVVTAPLLWMWWRELLRPEVWPVRPKELDEPPGAHRGLHGEDPPPTRW